MNSFIEQCWYMALVRKTIITIQWSDRGETNHFMEYSIVGIKSEVQSDIYKDSNLSNNDHI